MVDEAGKTQQPDWEREFVTALNQHGYSFHFRTLKAAEEAANDERSSDWVFQVSEFPVEVRGKATRIDYVLQRTPRFGPATAPSIFTFLVVECKRANPAYKRWCFARAPYVRRNWSKENLLTERVLFDKASGQFSAGLNKHYAIPYGKEFHIGLELKLKEAKGDSQPKGVTGTGAIEDAATQVTLCLNGLIEFFKEVPPSTRNQALMTFIPIIITTAQLLSTTADITKSDLGSGELSLDSVPMEEQKWLFYQYPTSPSLRHTIPLAKPESDIGTMPDLGKSLEATYLRTVAIVQAPHIAEFLVWFGRYLS
jgi:hypothetical protein